MFGKLEVHASEVVWRFEPITFYIGELRGKLILAPHGYSWLVTWINLLNSMHNIIRNLNSVTRDWQYYGKYSSHSYLNVRIIVHNVISSAKHCFGYELCYVQTICNFKSNKLPVHQYFVAYGEMSTTVGLWCINTWGSTWIWVWVSLDTISVHSFH